MNKPAIPAIPGVEIMTPLEMNSIHFDKNHTLLTPRLLASLKTTTPAKADSKN